MRTQVSCPETMLSIALIISVTAMTSTAAADPPSTPPSAGVATVDVNDEGMLFQLIPSSFRHRVALGTCPAMHHPITPQEGGSCIADAGIGRIDAFPRA